MCRCRLHLRPGMVAAAHRTHCEWESQILARRVLHRRGRPDHLGHSLRSIPGDQAARRREDQVVHGPFHGVSERSLEECWRISGNRFSDRRYPVRYTGPEACGARFCRAGQGRLPAKLDREDSHQPVGALCCCRWSCRRTACSPISQSGALCGRGACARAASVYVHSVAVRPRAGNIFCLPARLAKLSWQVFTSPASP